MSRPPILERAFGQDDLARRHRLVVFSSFTLMMAHIVLITWGSAAGKLTRIPATFWNLGTDYPGMLLAVAGTGCLVMVVATSVKAARAKVRYESWHLIHLYAYLGVGLALPHQGDLAEQRSAGTFAGRDRAGRARVDRLLPGSRR
ncbi:MAG TPA: ferric reductase-like transmembrane domain-containing protein [Propionibacteriaceae bacterium]|nr:ferric reductase-like transmembrane domain-containing protein [Propionibacteriaceae bacterium]